MHSNGMNGMDVRVEYFKPLVICAALYIIGYHIEIMGPDRKFGAYMLMCAYSGWKFINWFCPNVVVWFSLRSIFLYFLFKLAVSMFIGFFMTPFYLLYCIYRLVRTFV